MIVVAFAAAVLVETGLLLLPAAHEAGMTTSFREALFTATSAVCVTGLTVVDTESHWSTLGELIILGGIQVGGFGIMTLASLAGLFVSRRLGLRSRLLAQAESKATQLGDLRFLLRGVALITLGFESATAVLLALRFWLGYGESPGRAAYLGLFHAVSAFNNAGFGLWSDNLVRFATDPLVILPVAGAVIAGGLGYPVFFELRREFRSPGTWSVHTRIVLLTTGALLIGGTLAFLFFEWRNPATLGPLDARGKALAGFFQAVVPRTAGFNSLDYAQMRESTLLVTDALMFVGGASASTAGGIKVTTFTVLLFAIIAEARGNADNDAFHYRRIPVPVIRQSIAVALLAIAVVFTATLVMLTITGLELDRILFEVISAFATVGLTAGLTPTLPPAAQYVLIALMFLGRTGTITLASALALRQHRNLYHLPDERPVVG
ncbi:MAG: TrkH family potassium uptake protein [Actinomycetota bacterium]|nr:TrkH family potassium uptake protein [Actinomycetota bacterium]